MKVNLFPPLYIHELGQRANQEDSLYPSPKEVSSTDRLFLVCDGMGGHEKGEVASQTVCATFGQWSKQNAADTITDAQILDILEVAYKQLDELDNGEGKGMGTTLTLLYIGSDCITAAHIGDSRIYHIRPNEGILYQSRDHSLVFDLYRSGEITYEEMATHPQKNVITKAITTGLSNRVKPDIIHITDVQAGDYFYMCSDGMLEQMTNEELVAIMSSEITDEEKRQRLIDATAGNGDNHTAWLLHVETVTGEVGDVKTDEEMTSPCNAMNIRPQREFPPTQQPEQEVEIAEQNDVEIVEGFKPKIVSTPKPATIPLKKRKTKAMVLVILLALLIILLFFFLRPKGQTPREVEPNRVEAQNVTDVEVSQNSDTESISKRVQVTEKDKVEVEETSSESEIPEVEEDNEREASKGSFIRDIIEKLLQD